MLTRANLIDRECRHGAIFIRMKDMQKQIASLQSSVKYQRVATFTRDDGGAGVAWCDANGKERITAGSNADGVVMLPTKDLEVAPAKDLPDAK